MKQGSTVYHGRLIQFLRNSLDIPFQNEKHHGKIYSGIDDHQYEKIISLTDGADHLDNRNNRALNRYHHCGNQKERHPSRFPVSASWPSHRRPLWIRPASGRSNLPTGEASWQWPAGCGPSSPLKYNYPAQTAAAGKKSAKIVWSSLKGRQYCKIKRKDRGNQPDSRSTGVEYPARRNFFFSSRFPPIAHPAQRTPGSSRP